MGVIAGGDAGPTVAATAAAYALRAMGALPHDPDRRATKDDLAVLKAELLAAIDRRASETIRTLMFGMIASNATLVGLVLAAQQLD